MDTSELIRVHRRDQGRRGVLPSSALKSTQLLTRFARTIDPLDADAEAIEQFLDTLSLSARSRYTYVSTLHCFYAWAIHAGHTAVDPTADIIRPKFAPGMPRPIPDADLALALAMADPATAVILGCAAFAGMRCIEIARLARHDIRDAEALVCVHGKGDKPRSVPIHPELAAIWARYGLPRAGAILRRRDGRPVAAWQVSQKANDYLHGLGITSTAHQLRHWFGTRLYSTSQHDLLLVRDLMGHSSVTTTTVYAAWDRDDAHAAVAALSPTP